MDLVEQSPILLNQVYDRLRLAIGTCELEPGQRIRQAELAERLGVSRQPVSHALQLLKRDGLLEDSGRKGLQVVPIDPVQVCEIYQVRAALDALAARLAAQRVAAGMADAADLAALDDILSKAARFTDDTPLNDRIAEDIAFHTRVITLSGNRQIAEILAPKFTHVMRAMRMVLDNSRIRTSAWKEHATIARAILNGNAAEAATAAQAHAVDAGREIEARLVSGAVPALAKTA